MLVFGKPVVKKEVVKEVVVAPYSCVKSICIHKIEENSRYKISLSAPLRDAMNLWSIDDTTSYDLSFTGLENGITATMFANVTGAGIARKSVFPINKAGNGFNKELVIALLEAINSLGTEVSDDVYLELGESESIETFEFFKVVKIATKDVVLWPTQVIEQIEETSEDTISDSNDSTTVTEEQ